MAITKERLEELIEQKAKIFYFDAYEDNDWGIVEVDTKNFMFSKNENCYTNFCEETYKTNPQPYKMFEDALFETQEEAEWHKEFGYIFRIETLDLPKWEEIQKDKNFHYIRYYHPTKNFSFFIEIYKFTNQISVSWSGGCKKTDPRFDENWQLTKENYLIACRKAKELFLKGVSND